MSDKALRVLNAIPDSEKGAEGSRKTSLKAACAIDDNNCNSLVLKKMPEKALKVHNTLPESEVGAENFKKACLAKACTKSANANCIERDSLRSASVKSNGGDIERSELQAGNIEIEYTDTENLTDVEDVEIILVSLLERLQSREWVSMCEALNDVRRLSIFHKELVSGILGDVVLLVTKCLRNPRSAVCKTAIMAAVDIFKAYADSVVDSFDPLLVQLFLKSTQDKRFVCDAAERALMTMTTCLSPGLLLPKLLPYIKDRNPRIRAKASKCFSQCVLRMGVEGIGAYGIDKLVQVAVSQLNDQLPESRESARVVAVHLKAIHEKSQCVCESTAEIWANFCQSVLNPSDAQSVIRITCGAKENYHHVVDAKRCLSSEGSVPKEHC